MKLQRCKKAHVYNMNEELLCEAEVIDGIVGETATLQFPEPCSDILRSEVLVTFSDNAMGLVTCMCRLRDYKEFIDETSKHVSSVVCIVVADHAVLQRRYDLKIPVQIETAAFFNDEENLRQTAEITILDLSAGGLFCISEQSWSPGQRFNISPFSGTTLVFEVEVLRKQTPHSYSDRFAEDSPSFGYGCKFNDLAAAKEAYLRKYVFNQDILQNRFSVPHPE